MNNVAKLLQFHKVIDFDGLRLANPVYIVASQVDKHDVFGAILGRSQKLSAQLGVLCEFVSIQTMLLEY